jgi:hypothetical protein
MDHHMSHVRLSETATAGPKSHYSPPLGRAELDGTEKPGLSNIRGTLRQYHRRLANDRPTVFSTARASLQTSTFKARFARGNERKAIDPRRSPDAISDSY